MEFDNPDSAQCYNTLSHVIFPDTKLIYDIMIVYYFFVILLSHNNIKSNLKKLTSSFWKQLTTSNETDEKNEKEFQEDKIQDVMNVFGIGLKTLETFIYMMFGSYIKTWFILIIYPSLTNVITIFNNENIISNNFTNNVLSGAIIYTIISNLYDKSIVKTNKLESIFCVGKDIGIGLIIFIHESQISDLIKYSFYLTIKLEIISYLIMILII